MEKVALLLGSTKKLPLSSLTPFGSPLQAAALKFWCGIVGKKKSPTNQQLKKLPLVGLVNITVIIYCRGLGMGAVRLV